MDDLDRAKEYEQKDRQAALKAVLTDPQRSAGEQQYIDDAGNVLCLDCGDRIPQDRLQAKPDAVRCVPCKTTWEKNNK